MKYVEKIPSLSLLKRKKSVLKSLFIVLEVHSLEKGKPKVHSNLNKIAMVSQFNSVSRIS